MLRRATFFKNSLSLFLSQIRTKEEELRACLEAQLQTAHQAAISGKDYQLEQLCHEVQQLKIAHQKYEDTLRQKESELESLSRDPSSPKRSQCDALTERKKRTIEVLIAENDDMSESNERIMECWEKSEADLALAKSKLIASEKKLLKESKERMRLIKDFVRNEQAKKIEK